MAYNSAMSFIFIDESGDLGFDFKKKKTSKYFVITLLFAEDKNVLEKIVKKVFKGFSKMEAHSHNGVLHAYKESPKTKSKLLNLLRDKKTVKIVAIYLNKNKVYTRLQNEKHVLYNYVTNILLDRVYTKKLIPVNKKVCIYASRRETSRFLNKNFSNYIESQLKNNFKIAVDVNIVSPSSEKGLQVVDMVSWALFRKYEFGDHTFYNLIKSEIVEENPLFP